MIRYHKGFLRKKGYFTEEGSDTADIGGTLTEFEFDPDARLAYFQGVEPVEQQRVVSELRAIGRNFDFYWFWNPEPGRVAVYNRYGEHRWFIFNQSLGLAADARRSKKDQLASVDEGLGALFDIQAVVDRFYRNLWDIRLNIASALEVPGEQSISDSDRIMTAQRTIDRLIFCYFLTKKDIIHGIDDAGNRTGLSPGRMFETVLEENEFHAFLTQTFFDHLNAEGWTEYEVTEQFSITYPYLNGGLFRSREIPTTSGGTVTEQELDGASCDWQSLVGELNEYNWLIEESPTDSQRQATGDKLSPAVLGHIFEKFVITVSELSGEEELSLEELERMDVSATGEQLLEGNRQVGAYYTPNYIAYENTRETLWNRVRTKLSEQHTVSVDEIPAPDEFFAQIRRGESSLSVSLDDVDDVLRELTVLDPASGSGAFLMTAGEVLATWRRQTSETSRYEIRREIVRGSLYGVDLLDGAVEVCKLRLWLWLTSATTIDLQADSPRVETLPNIDFNIRQGNSLVGTAEPEYGSLEAHMAFEWTDGAEKSYPEAVTEYRENILEYQVAAGAEATELHELITTQRRILQEQFTDIYAQESAVRVEETVPSYEHYRQVMEAVTGKVKFNLDFDSAMTDTERSTVADIGFREQQNWQTTAYHTDIRKVGPERVSEVFDLMDGRGSVSIERPVEPRDVEALDPFHWIFEFPTAYATTGEDRRAFDVVIGNPPHGSSLTTFEKSLLEETYTLVEGSREVAKMFTERSWSLTDGELSYIVPKASTYNSNWEDFREFCLPKMHRGVDLGKAFRNVDHEQVTVHLSESRGDDLYTCGQLPADSYHLGGSATVTTSLAERLGTVPVSFSAEQQGVAKGLGDADFPTLAESGFDAGRGASTTNRIEAADAPLGYNGKQVQRYFTRPAPDSIDVDGVSDASRRRLECPKVMAQNIIAHVQNPYDHIVIAAAYDPAESYSFETVTNILLPDDADLSLPALTLVLNTQFVNWFVYFSVFNRAIRDMHLDRYFLESVVLPRAVSEQQVSVLDTLYGLLSISNVATEYDALPDATTVYRELQSIANALTYELYLTDVDDPSLQSNLTAEVAEILSERNIEYRQWYTRHIQSAAEETVVDLFQESEALYRTAAEVADSVYREDVVAELDAIADHPWVEIIERDQHRVAGRPPVFGPGNLSTPE